MNRKMAWLAVALVAMLVMLPLLTAGILLPEALLPTDKAALPPLHLQSIHTRSPAMPPEPVSVPLAVQMAMKPFLLLSTAMSMSLRQSAVALPRRFFPIDLCLLQGYRNHPCHAPPAYL